MVPLEVIDRLLPDVTVWVALRLDETVAVLCAAAGDVAIGPRTPSMTIREAPVRSVRRRVACLCAGTEDVMGVAFVLRSLDIGQRHGSPSPRGGRDGRTRSVRERARTMKE
ncbi:hypothetical protein VY88_15720 [Azospirillum thiophilum]|nr:hypothetical protein VY88_15720 [Azospirillum thiophilum]